MKMLSSSRGELGPACTGDILYEGRWTAVIAVSLDLLLIGQFVHRDGIASAEKEETITLINKKTSKDR